MDELHFDIYAVGLFLDLRRFRATRDWRRLRHDLRYLRGRLAERNWRAARNYFNGYLAEPIGIPGDQWHRAGRGWTREAAKRNFRRRNRHHGGMAASPRAAHHPP